MIRITFNEDLSIFMLTKNQHHEKFILGNCVIMKNDKLIKIMRFFPIFGNINLSVFILILMYFHLSRFIYERPRLNTIIFFLIWDNKLNNDRAR